jgi:heme/copper-type cytochrome/quinol oxidase subunit 3
MSAPALLPLLWHLGALMVCIGGYWFWFAIRVDVAAEGNRWYRVYRADLFILSLLATTTLALIWSYLQWSEAGGWASLGFWLFIVASTVLFGGVMWSKFAHMFFKPAAAYQRRVAEADGSRDNLPSPADAPEKFGLGINRELPRHY